MEKFEKGYYWVGFYNHGNRQIMFFNGNNFEKFRSDVIINDEIDFDTVERILY